MNNYFRGSSMEISSRKHWSVQMNIVTKSVTVPGPGLLYGDIHCVGSWLNSGGSSRHVTPSKISSAIDDEGRDVTSTAYPRIKSGQNIPELRNIKQFYDVTASLHGWEHLCPFQCARRSSGTVFWRLFITDPAVFSFLPCETRKFHRFNHSGN